MAFAVSFALRDMQWSSYHQQYGFYVIVKFVKTHLRIDSKHATPCSPHYWVSMCPVSTVAGNNINSNNINYPDSDVLHVQQQKRWNKNVAITRHTPHLSGRAFCNVWHQPVVFLWLLGCGWRHKRLQVHE